METASESAAAMLQAVESIVSSRKSAIGHWHMAAGLMLLGPDASHPLCIATGTRCCPPVQTPHAAFAVRDCHAEVIVRRCFNLGVLSLLAASATLPEWLQPREQQQQPASASPATGPVKAQAGADSRAARGWPPDVPPLRWNAAYSLQLVISDAPCGDAAVRPVPSSRRDAKEGYKPTGAKPLAAPQLRADTGAATCGAGFKQRSSAESSAHRREVLSHSLQAGAMRSKAARSDLRQQAASHCVACSDKVAAWAHLGLSSSLLAGLIGHVPLSSLVVCADDEPLGQQEQHQEHKQGQLPHRVWSYALAVHRAVVQRQPAYLAAYRRRTADAGTGGAQAVPWETTAADAPAAAASGSFDSVCDRVRALPFVEVEESAEGLRLRTVLPHAEAAAAHRNTCLRLPDICVVLRRFKYGRFCMGMGGGKASTTPECYNELMGPLASASWQEGAATGGSSRELLHSSKGFTLGATKAAPVGQVSSRLCSWNMLKAFLAAHKRWGNGAPADLRHMPYGQLKRTVAQQRLLRKQQWRLDSEIFASWPHTASQHLQGWSLATADAQAAAEEATARQAKEAKRAKSGRAEGRGTKRNRDEKSFCVQ